MINLFNIIDRPLPLKRRLTVGAWHYENPTNIRVMYAFNEMVYYAKFEWKDAEWKYRGVNRSFYNSAVRWQPSHRKELLKLHGIIILDLKVNDKVSSDKTGMTFSVVEVRPDGTVIFELVNDESWTPEPIPLCGYQKC